MRDMLRDRRGLIGALTVVAVALRFSLAHQSGFWRDEALFLGIVQSPTWSEMFHFLRFNESHPPLFYILMRIWVGLCGDSHAAVVALPVVLGAAIVPSTYYIVTRVFGNTAAIVAATMTAISPSLSFYSALVRPYSLLPLLGLLSCYALWQAITTNARPSWVAFTGVSILLLYTHNFAWVIVVSQGIIIGVAAMVNRRERRRIVKSGLLALAAILVCYLPWLSTFIAQARNAGYGAAHVGSLTDALELLRFACVVVVQAVLAPTIDPRLSAVSLAVAVAGLIVASGGLLQWFLKKKDARSAHIASAADASSNRVAFLTFGWLPLISLGVGFALSFRSYLLIERCLIMLVPPLLVVAGWLITFSWTRLRAFPGAGWFALSLLVIVAGSQVLGLASLYLHPRSNARELAALVDNRVQRRDLILVAPVWLASSFNYYLRAGNTQFDYPDGERRIAVSFSRLWNRLEDPAALRQVKDSIARARNRNETIWLVTDREDLSPASREDYQLAEVPGQFEAVGRVRVSQILAMLQNEYRQPGLVLKTGGPSPRFEELFAVRFSPDFAP
jgi:4-amino-4-deoxy-L-arabinose transferase-like glycosyltransferase